jgi:hypothetical protein
LLRLRLYHRSWRAIGGWGIWCGGR